MKVKTFKIYNSLQSLKHFAPSLTTLSTPKPDLIKLGPSAQCFLAPPPNQKNFLEKIFIERWGWGMLIIIKKIILC